MTRVEPKEKQLRDIYPQGKNDDAKMWGKLQQTDRKTAGQSNDSACSFYDTTLFSYLENLLALF